MIQKRVQKILKEIALKHNKPYYVIEEIYLSQFRLTKQEINSLGFKTIKLVGWGKYITSNKKVKSFKLKLLNSYNKYGAYSNKSTPIQGNE